MALWNLEEGAVRRGIALVGSTGVAAVVAGLLFLSLDAPHYVARWDESAVDVGADGRRVDLVVAGGSCDAHIQIEIRASKEHVQLTTVVTQRRRPCRPKPVWREVSVWLSRPLGDRPLLDGRCTHPDADDSGVDDDCPAEPVVPVPVE